jgi:photosystem II P680 reaction center D1 protein|uniref:Uncharacterized protein orf227 n=2 Tax=Beta TaxID=3554 RepID=E6ZDW5_BETVM|nr:hypothetical protein LKY74_mgp070 [Beta vulgaris subsp. maritima]YP_004842135.1 hypothetical protein LKY79_mgp070 [Beta macrocarpa]CBL51979.1 hypothetical protein [Beta vulgaris subsp. maritima]CBX24940.1 hypothetical protein [Beta macrocarpa]CBX33231.1 hypothetical protein [Beta vulgaris subsp. maritima]CBX33304.1 hypothetical protein [Beta vulgaris subsp. maritima]
MLITIIVGILLLVVIYFQYYHLTTQKKTGILWFVNDLIGSPSFFLFFLLLLVYNVDVAWANSAGVPYDPVSAREWLEQTRINANQLALEGPPAPVFVPEIPELAHSLIHDELRRAQLYNRLAPHSFVNQFSLSTIVDLVYQQAEIEKKIEASLILDGISPTLFFSELNRLRGFLFYPHGAPISAATLARYIREIAQNGTRQSIPYRRVYRAIRNYELFWSYYLRNNQ